MQVWMKICRKQATCRHCPRPILKNHPMVVCRYYKKTRMEAGGSPQNWSFTIRFHPQCWIDQAVAALKEKVVVETRGRKKSPLLDNIRAARVRVLARRATVVQRIRAEMAKPKESRNIDRIIHLGGKLNELKEEIAPLGGVPKSWA